MGKGLFVIHLNIRSLPRKIDLLRAWLVYNKPAIITLSETWLNSSIGDAEISLDGYILYREDRGSRGGGVATYISSSLSSELIAPSVGPLNFECLFVKVSLHQNKRLIIGNIYRPPNSPSDSTVNILTTINSLNCSDEMMVLGDFNSNWLDRSSLKERTQFESLNLTQLIKEPTRIAGSSKSLLDWILVTHPNRIANSGVLPDCFSDHSIIFCVWKIRLPRLPPKVIQVRQYHHFNAEAFIQDLLNINWHRFELIPYAEDAWNFFYTEVLKVIDKHAPLASVKVKGHHLPWISGDLIHLFKQRDKAWERYHTTKNVEHLTEYKRLRNICTVKTRNAKSDYYKNSLSNNFTNPKQFWKKLNGLLNKSSVNSPQKLRLDDNNIITDPISVADAFNQHFSSVCRLRPSDFSYSNHVNSTVSNRSFSFSSILPTEVQQSIAEIKSGSSTGPDGLEIKFLKMASHVLSYPLCDLFNLSLSTCTVPIMWKCAKVIPLHKSGDPLESNNYRPISIISNVAKIFEKIIFKRLFNYINESSILSPCQSGFRPNFSTTTVLTKFVNDVTSSLDVNMPTGAIFIDLTKAFDLVDHYLLLDKLHAIGLSEQSMFWFNSYLHYRRQCVSVSGALSQFMVMEQGVPQGSCLGPLLFSIFINDLPQICGDCQTLLYADDTVIYTSKRDICSIQSSLQTDFDIVQKWFLNNGLILNKLKSHSMLFSINSGQHTQANSLMVKFLDGTVMESVDEFKYLGLWLDSHLSFRPHIDSIVKKINFNLRQLYRSINCFTQDTRLKIVTQLLFPIIDYADTVYMNTTQSNLKSLTVVYNSICRFVLRCPFLTHHCDMYQRMNILSPSARRRFHWFQFIYKCKFFNYPLYLRQYLISYSSSYALRHHDHVFFSVPRISKEIGRRAFQFKAPSDWNSLPSSLRSITSFPSFKVSLQNYIQSSDQCRCFS